MDYIDKKIYELVKKELLLAAEYHGYTTYEDVARIMGIYPGGSGMGKKTGDVLGAISKDEFNEGRPMLSALAGNKLGEPGKGFFSLARDIGALKDDQDEQNFLLKQREQLYEIWKRPIFKPKTNKR